VSSQVPRSMLVESKIRRSRWRQTFSSGRDAKDGQPSAQM
jgi:hypothetical protein